MEPSHAEAGGEPRLTQTLRAHRAEVRCVDATGAKMASGAGDGTVRTWRWERGAGWQEAEGAKRAHRYGVSQVRWAPSGALLASGGVDGAVRVWSASLAPRRALAAPGAAAVRALCWMGRRVLVGHDDGALCVWHASRGAFLVRIASDDDALLALAVAAQTLALAAHASGELRLWDVAAACAAGPEAPQASPLAREADAHDLGALCADACGSLAATGGHDGGVRLWHVSGALSAGARLAGHSAAVTSLRFGGDGSLLASASLDRSARLWAPFRASCLRVLVAHPRYLTCVLLAADLRYMVTGSNDKSLRMWSLGDLTLDDELDPPCTALSHFGLGDLEGIGPVDDVDLETEMMTDKASGAEGAYGTAGEAESSGARRVWRESDAHTGPINCLATHGALIATASSDGQVKMFRWEDGQLQRLHTLPAHQYPATAVDFGASGGLLLSAGLDGRAAFWDVETGVQLRELSVPNDAGGEVGGGGVRGARTAGGLLLLATDDGVAPLWSLSAGDAAPLHVFTGHAEAVTCCAWSVGGLLVATGAASGELRLHCAGPTPRTLFHQADAHDLGVQSCDFAPSDALKLPRGAHLLASAGCDSFINLWLVNVSEDDMGEAMSASMRVVRQISGGDGISCVRWGAIGDNSGALLASAGADRWARVWRLDGVDVQPQLVCAVATPGVGGALCVALLPEAPLPLLAVGAMDGSLVLWRMAEVSATDDEAGEPPALWGVAGVCLWLREYFTRAPGSTVPSGEEAAILSRARSANLTGARLLSDPLPDILLLLGYGPDEEHHSAARAALLTELRWLRRPTPPKALGQCAPHSLLCPLSHCLLREPAFAADGFSYERANILDWFVAADGAISPVSGRRLRSSRVSPNRGLRRQLSAFLDTCAAPQSSDPLATDDGTV